MDKLIVTKLPIAQEDFNYFTLESFMHDVPWQEIKQINWPESFPDLPSVRFQIAHNNTSIFLHFRVQEDFLKAQYVRPNEPVYEDSCVEFFISFDNKTHYYNLEFNVLGNGLIGYGPLAKSERKRLSAATIQEVDTTTVVVNAKGKKVWSTVLMIPVRIFEYDTIEQLSGLTAHANFYKCGDGLPVPHYVSWQPIRSPKPNFHLPEFFGELLFA